MKQTKTFFTMIMCLSLLSITLKPAFVGNYSCTSFQDQCTTTGDKRIDSTIGQLIVVAGGYYLDSHANLKLLLSQVELSELNGLDYAKAWDTLCMAIDKMEMVNASYLALINKADGIDYNPVVVNRLKSFDYNGFRKEFNLNPTIFKRVEYFLSKGNVRGVYKDIFIETGNILEKLYIVRESLDSDMFPTISNLWRINQRYAEVELFGQYVAEVFCKLNELK